MFKAVAVSNNLIEEEVWTILSKRKRGKGEKWDKERGKRKLCLFWQYWSTWKNKLAEVKKPEEIKPQILFTKGEVINNIATWKR